MLCTLLRCVSLSSVLCDFVCLSLSLSIDGFFVGLRLHVCTHLDAERITSIYSIYFMTSTTSMSGSEDMFRIVIGEKFVEEAHRVRRLGEVCPQAFSVGRRGE